MKFFLLLLLIVGQLKTSGQDNQDFIKKAKWLEGTWQGLYNGAPFYEAWKIHGDSLVNYTIEIKGTDTTLLEQTSLRNRNNNIVFGKRGDWTLKRLIGNELVLENDTSKFSNRMIYLHLTNDHWFVLLEHPKSTMYYDLQRFPALDPTVDELIKKKKR